MSRWRALRWIGVSFGEIIRNTPILVQLLWVYYVLPIVFAVRIDALTALIIGLSIYQAAFISEVYRSGHPEPCRKAIARRPRCWGSRRSSPSGASCCRRRSA